MAKQIDETNLGYLISKIKAAFWHKTDVVSISIDTTPTANSTNLVTSGGVKSYVDGSIPSVPVQDVTVDGTSVVDDQGVAEIPAIPDEVEANPAVPSGTTPTDLTGLKVGNDYYNVASGGGGAGTLDTTATSAQTPVSNESLGGSVTLHKVSKTGTYSDLIGKPTYAQGVTEGGIAVQSAKILYGVVDSTSTSTAFTAQIRGITALEDGICIYLTNNVVPSATGYTIDINSLGAKPVYLSNEAATQSETNFAQDTTYMFVYNSTRVTGGCWDLYYSALVTSSDVAYRVKTNYARLPVATQCGRYRICFTSADGTKYVPANSSNSTSATTSKTVTTEKINPFGDIIYYNATTVVSAGGGLSVSALYRQLRLPLGYSFNRTGAALTLTSNTPVYIKCSPQTDGSVIIDGTTPYVQALPTTEDGYVYIFLGLASSATYVEMVINHPVYYYKNGCVRLWTNDNVVHKTGSETISGEKTFNDNMSLGQGKSFNFLTGQGEGVSVEATSTQNDKALALYDMDDDSEIRIENVKAPINSSDAANKNYVDNAYDVFTYGSDTTPPVAGRDGLVPSPSFADRTKFLRGDGTWQVPQDTTYNNFIGATSLTSGSSGLVPAPSSGDESKFLCANGSWEDIQNSGDEFVELNGYSGGYGIQPWSLCAFALFATGTTMSMTSFTGTAGMGGGAPITGYQFPIGCKIYYHPDTQLFAATTNFVSKKFYTTYKNVDARYSSVTGMPSGYTLGSSSSSTVYLRVMISNGYWSPYYKANDTYENIVTSNNLIQGNFYIYLGKTVGSTGYTFQLEDNNPLYYYDGTALVDWASYISSTYLSLPWSYTYRLGSNYTLNNSGAIDAAFNTSSSVPPIGKYVVCVNALIKNPNSNAQQAHVLLQYRLGANAAYNTISAASVTLPPARTSSSGGTYGATSVFLQGLVTLSTKPSYFQFGARVEVETDGNEPTLVAESPLSGSMEGELDEGTTYIMMYKL